MLRSDIVIDWIQLYNTKNIGLKSFWTLVNLYGSAGQALRHIEFHTDRKEAEKIYKSSKGNVLVAIDDRYPKRLKNQKFPPPILYYTGNSELLNEKLISIIGSRNASITGRSIAQKFAEQLSGYYTIVSGMAKGIDTAALSSAIKNGCAIAVVPFGLDNIYPQENTKLFHLICKTGLVITEIPPGRHPDQGMFLIRNKLIAMLSSGIVVIEAALKSGTINTANMALDIGCEVMVVPGSPLDPRSFGSNLLIKNGATLVQTAQDVLEILGPEFKTQQIVNLPKTYTNKDMTQNNKTNLILTQLSSVPVSIDVLAYTTGVTISEILSIISQLELTGKIAKTPSNEIVLI